MSKRAQNRFQQRERILDAARLLFAEHGFEDVTVSEIAEKCGVSRATVFNHFRSKHGLIESITADVLRYYGSLLDHLLADLDTPVPDLLRALFSYMGAGIENSQPFYRSAFREIMRLQVGLEAGGVAHEARIEARSRLETLLARGQQRGELRGEIPAVDLVRSCEALTNGTITSWLYETGASSLQEQMERAAWVFLGGVAVAGAAESGTPLPDFSAQGFAIELPPPTRPHGEKP